jgi:hypothetical protein
VQVRRVDQQAVLRRLSRIDPLQRPGMTVRSN